jgi:hypothetical protein
MAEFLSEIAQLIIEQILMLVAVLTKKATRKRCLFDEMS